MKTNFFKSKITITMIIILTAIAITYFSGEESYQIKEVTKEIKLDTAKK